MDLKEKLDKHIGADEAHFAIVNKKLDKLLKDVAEVKGQWKAVGIAVGGIIGGAWAVLSWYYGG